MDEQWEVLVNFLRHCGLTPDQVTEAVNDYMNTKPAPEIEAVDIGQMDLPL